MRSNIRSGITVQSLLRNNLGQITNTHVLPVNDTKPGK